MAQLTLGELAVRFGLALRGDPDRRVGSVATLESAAGDQVAFLANPKLVDRLAACRAGAVVLKPPLAASSPVDCLLADNPHAAFARIAAVLHPPTAAPPGVHASAVVADDAVIDASAHVGPQCVVGARARIGARAVLGPGCLVGEDAVIAEDVRLVARVTVLERVEIGARSILHPGAVIGSEGFGYAPEGAAWVHVPQVGTVRIGADVEIGANTTVDRGALGDTVIGEGVKIDNLVQIGHNCSIGAHSALAGCVGLAGSSHVGARCRLGGGVGLAGHLTICDDVTLTGFTLVTGDIREPGVYSGGVPAEPAADWRRVVGRLKRLDALARRVSALERGEGADGGPDA
ncbi:MAG: UDP-3-O-(3-hydroxymyristoyl)glucosamine N-acyltransferase [Gammaproteobacteria bacterium]|nr:UDP-3-O-(3-hydroxymyristoyl)glucosamine N-acyltransferase [Gammaproteobacteria bacterium]